MKALVRFVMMPMLVFAGFSFLDLGDLGGVKYTYSEGKLLRVQRLSSEGSVLYTHEYTYDEEERLSSENLILDLGKVEYSKDGDANSPYGTESFTFDERGNITRNMKLIFMMVS